MEPTPLGARRPASAKPLQFSLYFFGNYPAAYHEDKYRLILESARFADQHGFAAVWLPERHFHAVGGFSPNPSLLAAALARDTERIALRGGSVVLPLHHPVRVAEEWSLVDNLSHGRVGHFHRLRLASERFHFRARTLRAPPRNLPGRHRRPSRNSGAANRCRCAPGRARIST